MIGSGKRITLGARLLTSASEKLIEGRIGRALQFARFFEATVTTLLHGPLPLGESPKK